MSEQQRIEAFSFGFYIDPDPEPGQPNDHVIVFNKVSGPIQSNHESGLMDALEQIGVDDDLVLKADGLGTLFETDHSVKDIVQRLADAGMRYDSKLDNQAQDSCRSW